MLAVIISTDRCNLQCKHCLKEKKEAIDLDVSTLEIFLKEFRANNLGNRFSLSGGEATIHHDLDGILQLLRKYEFTGALVSNGQDQIRLSKIIPYQDVLDYVLLSIEGPDEATNDKIRGRGSFENITKAIVLLKNNKFPVRTRTVLNQENKEKIEEMFEFAKKYKVDLLSFSTIQPCVNAEVNSLVASEEEFQKVYAQYLRIKSLYPEIKTTFNRRHFTPIISSEWPTSACYPMSEGELAIRPNGDISFCCDLEDFYFPQERYSDKNDGRLNHILGNMRHNSLKDILLKREQLMNDLSLRREQDAKNNKLNGSRQYLCENCKFYFFKK